MATGSPELGNTPQSFDDLIAASIEFGEGASDLDYLDCIYIPVAAGQTRSCDIGGGIYQFLRERIFLVPDFRTDDGGVMASVKFCRFHYAEGNVGNLGEEIACVSCDELVQELMRICSGSQNGRKVIVVPVLLDENGRLSAHRIRYKIILFESRNQSEQAGEFAEEGDVQGIAGNTKEQLGLFP